jgi:EpsD family peptidyl-prolyl cis-trans isomerase
MQRPNRINIAGARLLAAALVALVAACGSEEAATPVSQVAAKVNREEITVHQLSNALAQYRALDEAQQKVATKQVLERMIDQQLLVQKAVERKLDRDPRIVQAIEASKRQILAQAYLEQLGRDAARPSAEEIRKFYVEHPELFAERKIYRLQELAVLARPELAGGELEGHVRAAKSLDEVGAWLRSLNVPFNVNATVKAAEQLPIEMLPRLAQLQPGQLALLSAQQGHVVVQVVTTERQPLDEKRAQAFIERFLVNQRRLELARAEVKSLREAATIEYGGDFEAMAERAETPGPAAPAAPAAPGKSAIEKGVAGLR